MLTVCYINRQPGRGYHYSDTNATARVPQAKKNTYGIYCILLFVYSIESPLAAANYAIS